MTEDAFFDEFGFDFEDDEDPEDTEPLRPPWWRPVLIGIAAVTAAAMLLLPLYNVINSGQAVADNGLEVCGWDYCVVQDAARQAGIGDTMSLLANTFLSDDEARRLASTLLDHLNESNVSFVVVDRLDGDLKGQYDPASRTITVERPVRAWIVLHEVAHVRAGGHGEDFQDALIGLTRWLEDNQAA